MLVCVYSVALVLPTLSVFVKAKNSHTQTHVRFTLILSRKSFFNYILDETTYPHRSVDNAIVLYFSRMGRNIVMKPVGQSFIGLYLSL